MKLFNRGEPRVKRVAPTDAEEEEQMVYVVKHDDASTSSEESSIFADSSIASSSKQTTAEHKLCFRKSSRRWENPFQNGCPWLSWYDLHVLCDRAMVFPLYLANHPTSKRCKRQCGLFAEPNKRPVFQPICVANQRTNTFAALVDEKLVADFTKFRYS